MGEGVCFGKREVKLEDIDSKNLGPVYAQEYRAIHQQRTALVSIMHRWHAIGLPVAIAIFGIFVREAIVLGSDIITEKLNELLLVMGTILAQTIIVYIRYYAQKIDSSIVHLYPRIICLEILLDYHFYRHYLSTKGCEEKHFVEKCEGIQADTTKSLWERVLKNFELGAFPGARRGHGILNWAACTMIAVFCGITILLIFVIERTDENAFLAVYVIVTVIVSALFILAILKPSSAQQ